MTFSEMLRTRLFLGSRICVTIPGTIQPQLRVAVELPQVLSMQHEMPNQQQYAGNWTVLPLIARCRCQQNTQTHTHARARTHRHDDSEPGSAFPCLRCCLNKLKNLRTQDPCVSFFSPLPASLYLCPCPYPPVHACRV